MAPSTIETMIYKRKRKRKRERETETETERIYCLSMKVFLLKKQ
jgi:hypothetical protein